MQRQILILSYSLERDETRWKMNLVTKHQQYTYFEYVGKLLKRLTLETTYTSIIDDTLQNNEIARGYKLNCYIDV